MRFRLAALLFALLIGLGPLGHAQGLASAAPASQKISVPPATAAKTGATAGIPAAASKTPVPAALPLSGTVALGAKASVSATGLSAGSEVSAVALRLSIKEAFFKLLQEKCKDTTLYESLFAANNIREAELFAVLGADKKLSPVLLVKAAPSFAEKMRKSLIPVEVTVRGEWLVCSFKDNPRFPTPTPATFERLLKTATAPSPYPLYAEITPPILCEGIHAMPEYAKMIKGTAGEVFVDELGSLEKFELRTTTNATSLRIITLATTRPGTPLNTLFCQRLPASLPPEHNLMSSAGTMAYGYMLCNPLAVKEYLEYLAGRLQRSSPELAGVVASRLQAIAGMDGYVAFASRQAGVAPLTFMQGHWSPAGAQRFLEIQFSQVNEMLKAFGQGPASKTEVTEAFKIGEIPVWKSSTVMLPKPGKHGKLHRAASAGEGKGLSAKDEDESADNRGSNDNEEVAGEITALPQVNYYALRNGSLLCAGNPEALTNFLQSFENAPTEKSFAKAFAHYPTITLQMKLDCERLLRMLSPTDEVTLTEWINPCPPIYVASSLSKGQMAFTWDIPLRLFEELSALTGKKTAPNGVPHGGVNDPGGLKSEGSTAAGQEGTAASASPVASWVKAGQWTQDYEAALAEARRTKRLVVADFTGSDWCGWCMKLDKEVFATAEFKKWAAAHVVLLKLDFPHNIPQSAALKAMNEKLGQKFGIRGLPTIVILSADGSKKGETGYRPGGAAVYIKELEGLMK